jgi:biopolymer transport protein ExbD
MSNLKKTPQINAASMADISFILLIFFLVVTTMGSEFGLIRMLPPMEDNPDPIKIIQRNVFVVAVSQNNAVLVRNEYKSITDIREMAKDFFNLNNDGIEYPEKEPKDIKGLGMTTVNKGAVVSLQNDRGTSYRTYIQVQNELAAAVHELRNEFSMQKFGKNYDDCSEDQQDIVGKQIYPMAISEAEPKDVSNRNRNNRR